MKLRKMLAALAVTAVATLTIVVGGEGGAAANTTATGGVVTNWANPNGPAMGALHFWEGQGQFYAKGAYDALLTPGRDTLGLGWLDTAGFYVGYGTRANTFLFNTSTQRWEQHAGAPGHPALNRGWYQIGNDKWRVQVFYCGC